MDISVILTAHREGVLAGTTTRSACAAIKYAQDAQKLRIEVIVVLDNATADTRRVIESGFSRFNLEKLTYIDVKTGDPGQSRNEGIRVACGECATFLDGDDLWSENWLAASWEASRSRSDVVWQSACNLTFGAEENLWWHCDSESDIFDADYLKWGNYWDAMSFSTTEVYRRFPFKANNLKLGFGHEDWHWSAMTFDAGIAHKPVAETIHFKRRRPGSQMSLVEKAGALVWPQHLR